MPRKSLRALLSGQLSHLQEFEIAHLQCYGPSKVLEDFLTSLIFLYLQRILQGLDFPSFETWLLPSTFPNEDGDPRKY